jgi:chromosome partitioning protein
MKTIAFLSQKGGSGKTTLAVHTAVAAQENGERVVVVDTDMQKSAATWSEARHDMTLCIIDTAPHAAAGAARVVVAADLVIIPCHPTAFDLAAVEIVQAASARAVFVLSACPFRALRSPRPARCWKASGYRLRRSRLQTAALSRGPLRPAGP